MPLKVLFDNTIMNGGLFGEHNLSCQTDTLMGREYVYATVEYRITSRLAKNQKWRQQQLDCLPTVARLAREGRIEVYKSDELYAEGFVVERYPSQHHPEGNLFHGLTKRRAQPPLDRSKFGPIFDSFVDIDRRVNRQRVIDFCKHMLLSPSPQRVEELIAAMARNPRRSLSEFEVRCLRRLHVFKSICQGLTENHYPDALHWWTAEENGLDYYLMIEKRFRNAVQRKDKLDLKCKIIWPDELLQELSVTELDPWPSVIP